MSFQDYPAVAADADGDFVVTWYSTDQDGSSYGIFARRFSSSGAPLATEFQVNAFTTGRQFYPKVASEADGDFVVVWESPQDGSGYGVFGRHFSSAGAALAVEFQVNVHTLSGQLRASLEMDPDGDFLVAWHSFRDGGASSGIFARRFSSTGLNPPSRVPSQHLHHRESDEFRRSVTRGRHVRRRLDQSGPGRLALWQLRPPLHEHGVRTLAGVPGQHLYRVRPAIAAADRRRLTLRRVLDQFAAGRLGERRLRPALRPSDPLRRRRQRRRSKLSATGSWRCGTSSASAAPP